MLKNSDRTLYVYVFVDVNAKNEPYDVPGTDYNVTPEVEHYPPLPCEYP